MPGAIGEHRSEQPHSHSSNSRNGSESVVQDNEMAGLGAVIAPIHASQNSADEIEVLVATSDGSLFKVGTKIRHRRDSVFLSHGTRKSFSNDEGQRWRGRGRNVRGRGRVRGRVRKRGRGRGRGRGRERGRGVGRGGHHTQTDILLPDAATRMTLSPSAKRVAVFCVDGTLNVFDTKTLQPVLKFNTQAQTTPTRLAWCEDICLVIHWRGTGIMVVGLEQGEPMRM